MGTTETMAHLSDADLVRHLDLEGDAAERARREEHVRSCDECAARVRLLGHQSETIASWLERTDQPLPAGSAPEAWAAGRAAPARAERARTDAVRPWLRAAAIILLIAAPLAALQPVREWVVERIGLAEETGAPAITVAEASDPAVIRFTPAPGVFTVHVAEPAGGASLAIGRTGGEEAVLRGASGGEAPVVSDAALRLAGGAAAAGRLYDLRVPAAVEEVRVIVGSRLERIGGAELEAGSRVDLSVNR
ncbi:MAG: hypothetical protein KY466_04480 [Gemmatimonadetes bacterium]|nr:hypothetical protein [Gemmatimonadota bacterium]